MAQPFALTGGTLYIEPGVRVCGGTVLVREGEIVAAGEAQSVPVPHDVGKIDCTGCTVMAGFWNSHVHFFERKWTDAAALPAAELTSQLHEMIARYGFVNVFDLSSVYENTCVIRRRIDSGEVRGPRILTTGEGLVSPGSLPSDHVFSMMGVVKANLPEPATAEEALDATRNLLSKGVDGIKLFLQPGSAGTSFTETLVGAVANEAHSGGKPVFAHPTSADDVRKAITSGVDVVAHTTPHGGTWGARLAEDAAAREAALTPTLSLWEFFARHDRASIQERVVDAALGQLREWHGAGAGVLFGTDLGAGEYDPVREYELMNAAGMSFDAILASLTTEPAKRFGDERREGRIRPGFRADLTVVRADPKADIRAMSDVNYAFRSGALLQ